jgi:Tol biopolymer transport system component
MTTDRHLERDLPAILGEIATGRYPDYIDDVLATTAQRRQRPAWTFPERWFPVDLATKALPGAPRLPWRAMAALAVLALLLGAALALYVGSQQRPLPAPFGRAANGSILFAEAGDIYTADPLTGVTTAIVVSPETDLRPIWSLDGTRVVFERKVKGATGEGWLFVANQDGRGLVQVTPTPLLGLADYSFSPDGRSIMGFATGDRGMAIMVVARDGSGAPAFFDVGATPGAGPPRYRPDGSEIMFLGREPGNTYRGEVYALDPKTGNVRTVISASTTGDITGASWSPDGTRVAYGVLEYPNATPSTHVASADGTGDIVFKSVPDRIAYGGGAWSNDGTRLIVAGIYQEGVRSVVLPIDGSSVGLKIECLPGAGPGDCMADWIWSPDDSVLLGAMSDASGQYQPQFLADPLTGKIRPAPWTATGHPAWQRVAR